MGKLFSNGIKTSTGLFIEENTPADDRIRVETYSDLAALQYKYHTMIVRVMDEGNVGDAGFLMGEDYIYDEVNDIWNIVEKTATDLPKDFFASCGGGTFTYPSVPSSTVFYITDQNRFLDLQPFLPVTLYFTNEIVRNGNDLWLAGNNNITPIPNIIIHLKNCKIVNNELTFEDIFYTEIDLGVTLHGFKYHRGFIYFSTRPSDITVATKIYKLNAYDLTDVKNITLPIADQYLGNTTDIIPYKNYIYAIFRKVVDQPAYIVRITQDLDFYEPVFSYGTTTTARAFSAAPFIIYNDEIYIPTQDRTSGTTSTNTIGLSVYSLTGDLKRSITGQSIGTNTAVPTPHWMSVFNGKVILHTATGGVNRKLIRFDCYTLALEEYISFTALLTDDNTILSDGWVYLNQEGNNSGSLFRTKYDDFTTLEVVQSNYRSSGSIQNTVDQESLKTKLSQFQNDLGIVADAINDGVTTIAPSQNAVFDALALKAPSASPALTGTPTAPTATSGTNTTQIATTAFVTAAVASGGVVIDAIPTDGSSNAVSSNGTFDALATKQATLVSGTNIKTVGGQSLVGSGDVTEVVDAINDGVTTTAPSQNAVFDALLLKGNLSGGNTWVGGQTFSNNATFNANPILNTNIAIQNTVSARWTLNAGSSSVAPTWTRNTADAVTTAIFNNANASNTGQIAEFQSGGTTLASITKAGYITAANILLGSAALDFPSTAANATSDLTVTVTGAALGDSVFVGAPNAAVLAGVSYFGWVSATNTVTIRLTNVSAVSVNPASATFNVRIIK